jgi:hypothetical protein
MKHVYFSQCLAGTAHKWYCHELDYNSKLYWNLLSAAFNAHWKPTTSNICMVKCDQTMSMQNTTATSTPAMNHLATKSTATMSLNNTTTRHNDMSPTATPVAGEKEQAKGRKRRSRKEKVTRERVEMEREKQKEHEKSKKEGMKEQVKEVCTIPDNLCNNTLPQTSTKYINMSTAPNATSDITTSPSHIPTASNHTTTSRTPLPPSKPPPASPNNCVVPTRATPMLPKPTAVSSTSDVAHTMAQMAANGGI